MARDGTFWAHGAMARDGTFWAHGAMAPQTALTRGTSMVVHHKLVHNNPLVLKTPA
jgi:hypothetical protein